MTDRYCVIGRDVSRSPSPAMMNAAFTASGIDAVYGQVSVGEDEFAAEFSRLMNRGFRGMNVTIPFKTIVIPSLAGLDGVATRIQAVNTVKREDDEEEEEEGGGYFGHNTDPDGIVEPLKKRLERAASGTGRGGREEGAEAPLDLRNALLIGAGGAARAFCEAMNRIGCVDVAVAVRDVGRASSFAQEMEKAFPRMNLTLAPMDDLRHLNHDLVFNASPMGAGGGGGRLPDELKRILPGTKLVFDAVYRPRETELLVEAARNGSEVIYGEEMLLHQGMAAFKLWTGHEAPEDVMRRALGGGSGREGTGPSQTFVQGDLERKKDEASGR
jgi:shikimate dehydrogenase